LRQRSITVWFCFVPNLESAGGRAHSAKRDERNQEGFAPRTRDSGQKLTANSQRLSSEFSKSERPSAGSGQAYLIQRGANVARMEIDFYKNFRPLGGFRRGAFRLRKEGVHAEARRSSVVGGYWLLDSRR
jgi:hypothetical protein